MSKLIIIFVFMFSGINLFAQNNPCKCNPDTKKENQQRSKAKHETNYGSYPVARDTIIPATLYQWEKKYKNSVKTISTNPDNPLSLRKHGTPEDSMYVLKGYMWFVKQEDNDCDFHIEIGGKTKNSKRIIVEVPVENCDVLKKIFEKVKSKGYKVINITASNAALNHFPKGIPCVVIGLGFYDASHKPNTNHGDKHTYKCTWELHPVKDIVFQAE